jgi:hypothetical protein
MHHFAALVERAVQPAGDTIEATSAPGVTLKLRGRWGRRVQRRGGEEVVGARPGAEAREGCKAPWQGRGASSSSSGGLVLRSSGPPDWPPSPVYPWKIAKLPDKYKNTSSSSGGAGPGRAGREERQRCRARPCGREGRHGRMEDRWRRGRRHCNGGGCVDVNGRGGDGGVARGIAELVDSMVT